MRRLWERMVATYLHRWTSVMGVSPQDDTGAFTVAGDTWARGLAGLQPDQLGRGLAQAATATADGWPPTLPEFRALCLGIPSLAAVQRDLTRADAEREPFTLQVWRYIDGWAFARAEQRDANRMLKEAYDLAHAHVMAGGELPQRPAALLEQAEPEPFKPAAPEVARAHLAAIRASLSADPKESSP